MDARRPMQIPTARSGTSPASAMPAGTWSVSCRIPSMPSSASRAARTGCGSSARCRPRCRNGPDAGRPASRSPPRPDAPRGHRRGRGRARPHARRVREDPGGPRAPADHRGARDLRRDVVGALGHYGNCIGVPTVGGELYFDAGYDHNILVNAFTIGIASRDRIFRARAAGAGNPVIYVGARTGRDGIHGASLLASAAFDATSGEKRPAVQVGDPFTEKLLLEACLVLMQGDDVVAIQDMGAAGLTSSSLEMAGRGG